MPEGARIQLDPAVNVDAIPGITAGEQMIARALQKYGAYAVDCGVAAMAFGFEAPISGLNPYPGIGFEWDYYAMDHIPWHRLRVLAAWDSHSTAALPTTIAPPPPATTLPPPAVTTGAPQPPTTTAPPPAAAAPPVAGTPPWIRQVFPWVLWFCKILDD